MRDRYQEKLDTLEQDIERLKNEKRVLEAWRQYLRPLSVLSDKDKVAAFDALYERAFNFVKSGVEDGYFPDHYYMYEAALNACFDEKVWELI